MTIEDQKKEVKELALRIAKSLKTKPTIEKFYDFFGCLASIEPCTALHKANLSLQPIIKKCMKKCEECEIEDYYDLYTKSLKYAAPEYFEQYLLYMEIDRPPEERFYQPRRKTLKKAVDALQRLEDGEIQELFISQPPRTGKALANDTPILTVNGWKKHGDLEIGDEIFSPDGKTTKVIAVHPKCEMTHRVTFTDGTHIDCHFRHEWKVYDRVLQREVLNETQVMFGKTECVGPKEGRGHRYRYMLPIPEPIEGVHKDLSVDPYTLGAWLGDGTNQQPRINGDKADKAVIDSVPYPVLHVYVHKTTGVVTTCFDGLRKALQKYGLCQCHYRVDKFIPEAYMSASIEQRLELLAGLLDTDGCLRRKEHRYDFTTAEESLKDSVASLVSTFGWRVGVIEFEPKKSSSGINGRHKYWKVSFNPTMYIPCRLERKQLREFSKPRRIAIKAIEPLEKPTEGNCITVERDGMYLAGNRLTPTHNTTLLLFFMTWVAGRHPLSSNLYSSFSDTVTKSYYNGLIEIMKDDVTYHWAKCFDEGIIKLNAQYQTVDVQKKMRYPTITCRSIDGTLNGACDCTGIMIGDDLCSGIEQALSKERMATLWMKVTNDLLSRCKKGSKKLWNGTRWSVADPIGRRIADLEELGVPFEVLNLPALDENGESNFDYKYGVGFDTETYLQIKASFERNDDLASWNAQYMQQPHEREGTLFKVNGVQYYNGDLPDGYRSIFMACDPAWGGGDYVASPVCIQIDEKVFVPDAVYTNEDKKVSLPKLADAIVKYSVTRIQIEANKMTEGFADELSRILKERGVKCLVLTKPAPTTTSKEQRIYDKAPDIRDNFVFLTPDKRSKEYQSYMDNVFSFTITGKNKHDDAPDSLAMAADMAFKPVQTATTFKRFF